MSPYIKIHLNDFLLALGGWQERIDKLITDANSTLDRYNVYIHREITTLRSLGVEIAIYADKINRLLSTAPTEEININNLIERYEALKKRYEELIALADSSYQLKHVFPSTDNNWKLKISGEDFDLYIDQEVSQTAVKIKIRSSAASRTEALKKALDSAFQTIDELDYIDLSDNKLEDSAIQLLSNAINRKSGYEHIKLPQCEVLVLSNNLISKEGLDILLEDSATHKTYKHILLNDNHIDFDLDFFKMVIIPKSKQAELITLDLTMNFIPKGHMLYDKNIRLYYRKERIETHLTNKGIKPEERTYIKSVLSTHGIENCLRSFSAKNLPKPTTNSLVVAQEPNNQENAIDINWGAIGLFANKTAVPLIGEHAYLMVEGVSGFGQRYLIRGDLFYNVADKSTHIRVSQCSPQEFLKFAKNGKKTYCRTGIFKRKDIKDVLNKICTSHLQESYLNYAIYSGTNGYAINCITWAVAMLKEVIQNGDHLRGWTPTGIVKRNDSCNIL